jgi:hypothetical protein
MPDKIPFVLKITGTRGAIGKCYVIRYRRSCGYFMSRFPKKSSVPPTERQKKHRKLFKDACDYAHWIMSDPQRKQAFLNTLTPKKRRWQPRRWMVSFYMKASAQLKEKLKAKMQRSKLRLKPSIINSLFHSYPKHRWASQWQKPVCQLLVPGFSTSGNAHSPEWKDSPEPDRLI